MAAPSITQYQTAYNECSLVNRSGERPKCKYNWQSETTLSFDTRSFMHNNYGQPDFVSKSAYYTNNPPPAPQRPTVEKDTFYSQNFNYIGTESINRFTSHKSKKASGNSNLVVVSVFEKANFKPVEDVAKTDGANYLKLFHDGRASENLNTHRIGYQQNNQTALAPVFNDFEREPRTAEKKNMFASNSDRTIFPDKYQFTDYVWKSAAAQGERSKTAPLHPKFEEQLGGNWTHLDKYHLYRPPRHGIKDPGYIINSFNKQILPTVKVNNLKAASQVRAHSGVKKDFLHHHEFKV